MGQKTRRGLSDVGTLRRERGHLFYHRWHRL